MRHHSLFWNIGVWIGLLGLAAAGCGAGAYRERMHKRLEQLRRGGAGQEELSDPIQIRDARLELRVFKAFAKELSPKDGSEHWARRKPPFDLPGLLRTWEAHLEQSGKKMPYYAYVGLVEKSQNPQEKIRETIAREWQDAKIEWQDFPDAQQPPRNWKRCLLILAELDWVPLDPAGKETQVQSQNGIVNIFLLQEGNHWIIVACRTPQGLASPLSRDDLLRVWLATVKIAS